MAPEGAGIGVGNALKEQGGVSFGGCLPGRCAYDWLRATDCHYTPVTLDLMG